MEKTILMYTPKRNTEVWGYIDGDCVEVAWNKKTYKLTPVASYVWERCNGCVTVGEIVNDLVKTNNELLEKIKADVLELLESWKRDNLLIMNYHSLHSESEYDDSLVYNIEANVAPPVDVLLLSPPSPSPYAHRDVKLDPLGIGYLSAFLKSNGYSVAIMDLWVNQLNPATINDFVSRYSPKIIGISTKTVNFENGVKIAEIIKKISDDIVIIFGGYHVTFVDEEALTQNKAIDIVVRGEGEYTILELVDHFLHNIGTLNEIDGITYRDNGEIIRTRDRVLICDLDSLPFPDRISIKKDVPMGVQTSRGCPGKCIFCSARGLSGGRYRQRTAENIVSEVEVLLNRGANHIFFQDDTITIDLKRLNKILDLIEKKGLRFKWNAESRVDAIEKDPSIIRRMINAGCVGLQFGIESGSQMILDFIRKNISIEQIYNAVTLVGREGIELRCSFLIGHPFETYDTMLETVNLAKDIIDLGAMSMLAVVCPFPGSSIFEKPEYYKVNINNYYYTNYSPQSPVMDLVNLTAKQLKKYHYIYANELNDYLKQYKVKQSTQRAVLGLG